MTNNGTFKRIGGSKFIQATIGSSCKITVNGDTVCIDSKPISREADMANIDPDLHVALSRIEQESLGHEKWVITNISNVRVTTGFSNHRGLLPGESIDALLLATRDEINNSACIQGAKRRGLITLEVVSC